MTRQVTESTGFTTNHLGVSVSHSGLDSNDRLRILDLTITSTELGYSSSCNLERLETLLNQPPYSFVHALAEFTLPYIHALTLLQHLPHAASPQHAAIKLIQSRFED